MDTKKQIGGTHYQMQYQPVVFINDNNLSFNEGNLFKYLIRHPYKNGKEDLEKALHYASALTPHFKEKRSFYPILGFAILNDMTGRHDLNLIYSFWKAINTSDINEVNSFKYLLQDYICTYESGLY